MLEVVHSDLEPQANVFKPPVVRVQTQKRPYSTYKKYREASQRLAEHSFSIHSSTPYMSACDFEREGSRIAREKAKQLHPHLWRPAAPKLPQEDGSRKLEGFASAPHDIPQYFPPSFHLNMGHYLPYTLHQYRPHYHKLNPIHPQKWRHC